MKSLKNSRVLIPFEPAWPWVGGDLQTLRNTFVKPAIDLSLWPAQVLRFMASNGSDYLSGAFHKGTNLEKPLIIIVHGLTGTRDGVMIQRSAHAALQQGYSVLRLNLRGAGDTLALCKTQYHTGLTEDLRAVLAQLEAPLIRSGVVLLGYSLGGNQVLKFAAEQAGRGGVLAVGAVCAPIDLERAIKQLESPRNRLYHKYLLAEMKRQACAGLRPPEEKAHIQSARDIRHFDEIVTAPTHGFLGASDFYARNSSMPLLPQITIPSIAITAQDDPWIPVESYEKATWSATTQCMIVGGGGHCGFHQRGTAMPVQDTLFLNFLKNAL